jgi:hypothetical protein
VGLLTLSDAGGVLAPDSHQAALHQVGIVQGPHYWNKAHRHNFYYVIAIDYNRIKGASTR